MKGQRILLDTCALLWIVNGEPLADGFQELLESTPSEGGCAHVSPFSAWEIAMLVAKQRLRLRMSVEAWLGKVIADTWLDYAELSPRILIRSTQLPGEPPGDPADRIILATAREADYLVATRDRHLLAYAGEGHVGAIAC